ncbi:RNHCP domain-containing protein [Longirhabdus pacifica]|uniref:RNHCP domain-containing protein n=1 Tax=Longirhabdus pacifica TaxID=2305227 RepID=UPI001009058A|nr:RNHCP domain-containing protein [Longirhabdus pacifica]
MAKKNLQNSDFICLHCNSYILPLTNGSYRNHCPVCLHSLHLDKYKPGDRASDCKGIMYPIDVDVSSKKGYQIIFKCKKCGKIGINKAALNDKQSDNFDLLLDMMKSKSLRGS